MRPGAGPGAVMVGTERSAEGPFDGPQTVRIHGPTGGPTMVLWEKEGPYGPTASGTGRFNPKTFHRNWSELVEETAGVSRHRSMVMEHLPGPSWIRGGGLYD